MFKQTSRVHPRVTLLLLGVVLVFGALIPVLRPLILVGVLVGALAYASSTDRWLVFVLVAALLARILVILVDVQFGLFFEPPIGGNHHRRVQQLIAGWQGGQFVDPAIRTSLMKATVAHLLAPFYLLFSQDPIAGRFGVAVYGSLVGYPVFRIARSFADERSALAATAVALFWPSMLFRSVVYQREVMIVLAMLTVVWVAVRWIDEIRPVDLLVLVPAVWLVFVLREQNIVIVLVTLGVSIAFRNRGAILPVVTGVLGIALGAFFVITWFEGLARLDLPFSPEAIDAYAHIRARGDAAYLVNLHYRSWLDIVLAAPVKVIYFLYSPLPWQVDSLTDLLAGVSGWGLFVAVLLSGRGFVLLRTHPEKRATLAAYAISGITAYSIIEMNSGAAFRRRIQFVPIVLLLAVIALTSVSFRQRSGQPTRESIVSSEKESTTTMRRD